jgi:transcriptional regulator with XRE-family HTH domain
MAVQRTFAHGRTLVTSRRAFGEALRTERERRGIALDSIAKRTKLAASLLAALERGDCSRWPTGIYSRAYIREYASAIGLDREEVAARFIECFADTAFPDRPPVPEGTASSEHRPSSSTPRPSSLRMALGDEPPDCRRRNLIRRAGMAVLDLMLALGAAAVLSAADRLEFWVALACTSVCFHAITLATGGRSTAGLLTRALRPSIAHRRDRAAHTESAVAEPA